MYTTYLAWGAPRDSVHQAVNSFVIANGLNKKEFRYLLLSYTGYGFGLNVLNRVSKIGILSYTGYENQRFLFVRVRVWGAGPYLPTQGYIEYLPSPGATTKRFPKFVSKVWWSTRHYLFLHSAVQTIWNSYIHHFQFYSYCKKGQKKEKTVMLRSWIFCVFSHNKLSRDVGRRLRVEEKAKKLPNLLTPCHKHRELQIQTFGFPSKQTDDLDTENDHHRTRWNSLLQRVYLSKQSPSNGLD